MFILNFTWIWTIFQGCRFLNGSVGLTLGKEALEPELCVVIVSTVVMPRPTLAGAASMFIQKETHESITMRREGMYIWIK